MSLTTDDPMGYCTCIKAIVPNFVAAFTALDVTSFLSHMPPAYFRRETPLHSTKKITSFFLTSINAFCAFPLFEPHTGVKFWITSVTPGNQPRRPLIFSLHTTRARCAMWEVSLVWEA
jgi:hypothetical protein